MKPRIGIIVRPDVLPSGNKVMCVYEDIRTSVIESGGIPIGIVPPSKSLEEYDNNLNDIIDLCDGIILQGGDTFYEYDKKILEYVYKKDIPVLGICLGMQLMGDFFDGKLYSCKYHKYPSKKYVHEVYINKNSKLYEIIGKEVISVNSRHKEAVLDPSCFVSAISDEGIIEAIEDRKKKFFIGIQWHPENMYSYDILERKLFDYFIDVCRK